MHNQLAPVTLAIKFELAGDRCHHPAGQDLHDHGRRHIGCHGQGAAVRRWVGRVRMMIIMAFMMMMMMMDIARVRTTWLSTRPHLRYVCTELPRPGFRLGWAGEQITTRVARRPVMFSQKANPRHVYHGGGPLRSDLDGCLALVPEVVYLSGGFLRSDLCDCHSICCRGDVSQRS